MFEVVGTKVINVGVSVAEQPTFIWTLAQGLEMLTKLMPIN